MSRTVTLHLRGHGLSPGNGLLGPQRAIVCAVEGWPFSIVCLCPQWQVLNKAKNHIQELEQTLDNLLKLKGNRCPSATPVSFPGKDWLGFPSKTEIGLSQVNKYFLLAYRMPGPALGPGVQGN